MFYAYGLFSSISLVAMKGEERGLSGLLSRMVIVVLVTGVFPRGSLQHEFVECLIEEGL